MNRSSIMMAVRNRIEDLQRMRKNLENRPANREKDRLGWKRIKGLTRYYSRSDSDKTNGTYLGQKNAEQISLLAEKYRNGKYLTAIGKETNLLKKCLILLGGSGDCGDIEKVWENLPEEVKKHTDPPSFTDEEYAREWQAEKHRRNRTVGESPYKTLRGEYVRSKSENIIADRLFKAGIPYHYEINCTLMDQYGSYYIVQPDFTVLNKRTGRVYIWEHLGRLGDDEYCEDSLSKLNSYVRTG